jgi:hypothetical protein
VELVEGWDSGIENFVAGGFDKLDGGDEDGLGTGGAQQVGEFGGLVRSAGDEDACQGYLKLIRFGGFTNCVTIATENFVEVRVVQKDVFEGGFDGWVVRQGLNCLALEIFSLLSIVAGKEGLLERLVTMGTDEIRAGSNGIVDITALDMFDGVIGFVDGVANLVVAEQGFGQVLVGKDAALVALADRIFDGFFADGDLPGAIFVGGNDRSAGIE